MTEPLIFDIKRSSCDDGPGLRTVIFFKGCNLDCFWCHNPEGKSPVAQMAWFEEKCISCNVCTALCPSPSSCVACGKCVSTCPTGAKKLYGEGYDLGTLMDIIKADKPYFLATGGGVTFSGGECMLYPEYAARLASECKKEGISVAIDTAGCVPYESFEHVLPFCDVFLYDVKCIDSALHLKGTGKSNELILENLLRLKETGKQIIIRVPVIKGFNDGDELEKIKAFCEELGLVAELLPYHEFGTSKAKALIK